MTNKGIPIPYDVADEVTVATILNSRDFLQLELDSDEAWMHDDDIINNKKLIKAMNRILKYFGHEDAALD